MADSGVTALIGSHFYWIGVRLSGELPAKYAVMRRASDTVKDLSLSGGRTVGDASMEVTAYSDTPDSAQEVADAIAAAVIGDRYTMGTGVSVQRCHQVDESDLTWAECVDIGAWGVRSTYQITYGL